MLDLPYVEDSPAEVDMNVVMLRPADGGEPLFVEVQGTAEGAAFTRRRARRAARAAPRRARRDHRRCRPRWSPSRRTPRPLGR